MKRIALYGIGGLYNYGCEAIIRGLYVILSELHDIEIIYYTPDKNDETRIRDLNIKVKIISGNNKYVLRRAINKGFRIMHLPLSLKMPIDNNVIDDSDIIISIGGDMYTIPYYLRKRSSYPYINPLVDFGNQAIRNGKDLIIYGASIGPFGDYVNAIKYYVSHFNKCKRIICRESISLKYLKSIGVDGNTELAPDPAFFVDGWTDIFKVKEYIGINLSPLSVYEMNGGFANNVLNGYIETISELHRQSGLKIMLIPHVFSNKENDNDFLLLKKIADELSKRIGEDEYILVEPKSFINTKSFLRKCKVVIAARMHCGINAICENIPTIFLSYSSKSVGICEFIYGHTNWCIDLKEFGEPKFFEKVNNLLKESEFIEKELADRIKVIRNQKDEVKKIMRSVIE